MPAGTQIGNQDCGPPSSEDSEPTDLPIRGGNHHTSSPETVDLLGLHMKEVISTINRLESLGLQRMDIPLPKCVVLGEQSAGKSSVIEAISGIKTPRSDDTCTRCPLFIKLEPSEDSRAGWSASVSLRRSFSYDGRSARGSERRFRGWCELPQPILIPFTTTDNPEELEHIIGRAQLATISPLVDYQKFLGSSIHLGEHQRCEFSPNIVCISISQPGLPALSFYDLPGIIGQAETEDKKFLVKFVRDLVTEYVRDPEALILLCCSLETDMANSSAGGIARDLKAVDRCIGVLTKPDRLPAGSRHDKLKEIFDQKRFALGYGYFVVKNPGQDEINQGISHREARTREEHFFRQDTTWSSIFKAYTNYFGTLNLQAFLSKTLAEQMIKRLPTIDQHIFERLSWVEQELKQFPEPATANASRIMSDIILDFSLDVRREIEAEFPHKEWRNKWKALQKTFFSHLESMKPAMKLRGADDESLYIDVQAALPGASAKMPISLSDDEDDGEKSEDSDVSNKSPKKKRKIDSTASCQGSSEDSTDFKHLKITFDLDEIRKYLAENSQSRVPGQIEPRVIDTMMLTAIRCWEEPLNHFFSSYKEQFHTQIQELFKKHFESRKGSMFHDKAWEILQKIILPDYDMARDSLNDEKQGPYIFHEDLFEREKTTMLELYQQHRLQNRLALYKRKKEQHTKKPFTPAEEERVKKTSMPVLAHEPYVREIGVIAQVTTYYMLAARRFHDAVCMRIESKFHRGLCTQLRNELENGLGIRTDAEGYKNAIRLLAESTDRYKQRMDLVGQRKALLQGQKILRDLQHRYGGGGGDGAGMPAEEKMEGVEDML